MRKQIDPAQPLTGTESVFLTQNGKVVRTTVNDIVAKAPQTVKSVATKTGDITLKDIGLEKVSNTSDADKPVSTAQQAAIDKLKVRIERFTANTNASGIATIVFSPAFANIPDVDVVEDWTAGGQMVTGKVIPGSVTKNGCQAQIMLSVGTLLLNTSPFQKAGAGVVATVKAIGT